MIEQVYTILAWLSIGVTFSLGLCILFLNTPDTPALAKYRRARKIMAVSYLILSIMCMLEIVTRSSTEVDIPLTWTIILTMSAVQSLLFTCTFIVLIVPNFPATKMYILESLPVAFLALLLTATLFMPQRPMFQTVFIIFIIYYALMLVRYTVMFMRNYMRYVNKVDNYYSEQESAYLRWVRASFFLALAVGIGALTLSLTDNTLNYCVFTVIFIIFYISFGIQIVNYGFNFNSIERIFAEDTAGREETKKQSLIFLTDLEKNIEKWIEKKHYTKHGITIEDVARDLNTNRTYLSNYINTRFNCTFKEWIHRLRIEMAKQMLLSQPDVAVYEIGEQTGYADKSHFSRVFMQYTGVTPKQWRKSNKS
jgi:AraC-like DNA-binding protein